MVGLGLDKMPDMLWEYWGLIETMQNNPGLYGLDDKRSKLHDKICAYFKLSKEKTKTITDHLDKYKTAVDLWFAFLDLQEAPDE